MNTSPVYNNSQPFLPEYVDATNAADVFHYVGKKVSKCCDNRLRLCKVFMLGFEYEGCTFSFPFLLDRSLNVPAIIGQEYFNHITKAIMKQKQDI